MKKEDNKNTTHRSAKSICSSRQSSASREKERERKVSFREYDSENRERDLKSNIEDSKSQSKKIVEVNNSTLLNDAEGSLESKYNYMKNEYENYINELNKLNKSKTEECVQYKATIKNMFQDNSKLQVENVE